eukprot:scaffold32193_cov93-Attheya_sp.AAC.1
MPESKQSLQITNGSLPFVVRQQAIFNPTLYGCDYIWICKGAITMFFKMRDQLLLSTYNGMEGWFVILMEVSIIGKDD